MNINIINLVEPGVANKERLFLKVMTNDNLGKYIVYDTFELSSNIFYNRPKNTYWFPNLHVKAGDNIILYTKNGTNKSVPNSEGGTNHFFYWGLPNTIWNTSGMGAALLEVNTWDFKART